MEFLATTHSMGPSVCNYYNYSKAELDYIKTNWKDIAGNETEVQDLQVGTTSLGFVSQASSKHSSHLTDEGGVDPMPAVGVRHLGVQRHGGHRE